MEPSPPTEPRPGRVRVTPLRRLAFFLVVDTVLIALTSLAALLLARDLAVPGPPYARILEWSAAAVVAHLIVLSIMRVYRLSWTYLGLRDVARILVAVVGATAFLAIALPVFHANGSWDLVTASVVLIHAPIAFCALTAFRLSRRVVWSLQSTSPAGSVPTLLVGAGTAGQQVLQSIHSLGGQTGYEVRGFVDDDPLKQGRIIDGVKVHGPVQRLESYIHALAIQAVFICVAGAGGAFVRDVVRRCHAAGVRTIRIVPPLREILEGHVSVQSAREVRLEDLLGRETVRIDQESLRRALQGKRVLVTGGAGTIGSELCRQLARCDPARLLVLDVDETRLHDTGQELREQAPGLDVRELLVDVRDRDGLDAAFRTHRPEFVFHAAAMKHVPMMEAWPLVALDVNVLGTANVVEAAEAHGAQRFVLISTDKAVEPSSVMGATKRLAEFVAFHHDARPGSPLQRSAVRFGNVIGSRGSVLPTFERQLRNGGPLTVTHPDVERFFMMTGEAVSLVLQAATLGAGHKIFILDMGRPIRILEVAQSFLRLHGLRPDVDVRIEITGLRPGEKLTEVLHYPHEELRPTSHPRIREVDAPAPTPALDLVAAVRRIVDARDERAAHQFLHARFPGLAGSAASTRPTSKPLSAPPAI